MKNEKGELVLTAVQLARLGEELDTARAELKRLAESGTAYDSEEMKTALQAWHWTCAGTLWNRNILPRKTA